jgi:hypothetical protein
MKLSQRSAIWAAGLQNDAPQLVIAVDLGRQAARRLGL